MPRNRNRRQRQSKQSALQRANELTLDPRVLEDDKVKVLLAKARNAKTNEEALRYHLLLDKFLFGEHSLTENPERSEELSRARQGAVGRDRAEEAYAADDRGFVDDVFNRTEQYKLTGDKAEEAKAKAMQQYKDARNGRLAVLNNKRLEVDWMIEHGPKMEVMATGHFETIGSMPNVQQVLKPDIIRLMHRQWVFQPGLNKDVPEIFARKYESFQTSRQETQEREALLTAKGVGGQGLEVTMLERKMREIDKKYQTRRQLLGA